MATDLDRVPQLLARIADASLPAAERLAAGESALRLAPADPGVVAALAAAQLELDPELVRELAGQQAAAQDWPAAARTIAASGDAAFYLTLRPSTGDPWPWITAGVKALPGSVELLHTRALLHAAGGDLDHEIEDLRRIVELDPGHAASNARLAELDESPGTAVFRAFDEQGFFATVAWNRLSRILNTTGGPYGLVGARGAGKSWLMQRAVADARAKHGIGLWFPSPSEYDATSFISSLCTTFVSEIERAQRARPARKRYLRHRGLGVPATIVTLAVVFWLLYLWAPWQLSTAAKVALLVAVSVAVGLFAEFFGRLSPRGQLLSEAQRLREHVRFTLTQKEGSQYGVSAGKGITGSVSRSLNRELVERPTTLSSLIHDFRELAHLASTVWGKVVIAIDELDKIDDPETVRSLLRGVKGVLEVEGVHFLVSLSHEALRALRLGAIGERNEFNSSFYTVLELPPLSAWDCEGILWQRRVAARVALDTPGLALVTRRVEPQVRDFSMAPDAVFAERSEHLERFIADRGFRSPPTPYDPNTGLVLGVLAGGNAREVVRLAELVASTERHPGVPSHSHALAVALADEAMEFRRMVLTWSPAAPAVPDLSQDERLALWNTLPESAFAGRLAGLWTLILDQWSPRWARRGWETTFSEPWRRLLIRIHVGVLLADLADPKTEDELLSFLLRVSAAAAQSAAIARAMLAERRPELALADSDRPGRFWQG